MESPVIIFDDTPVNVREYWIKENPEYIKTLTNPAYLEEQAQRPENTHQDWKKKFYALDPSHPKAFIPDWVRYAKREKQNFRCHVLGWHEKDWIFNKNSGELKQVGILTVDHTLAGANGGLTTDANTIMIASFVNTKKGSKMRSYEEIREHFHSFYELYVPTQEEVQAINSLKGKGFKKVIL
jgi:hypothetical protein